MKAREFWRDKERQVLASSSKSSSFSSTISSRSVSSPCVVTATPQRLSSVKKTQKEEEEKPQEKPQVEQKIEKKEPQSETKEVKEEKETKEHYHSEGKGFFFTHNKYGFTLLSF